MIIPLLEKITAKLWACPWYYRFLFVLALGCLLAFGQPPVSIPFSIFISLPILCYLTFWAKTYKQAFLVGWCAGLGYFMLGLIWLIEPFLVEPEKHAILAPFALFGMAGGLATFWGAAFAISKWFGQKLWGQSAGLIIAWTLAEYLRSVLFTGFPWGLLSYSWVNTPVAQWAAYVGPFGLLFLTLLCGLMLVSFPTRNFLGPVLALTSFAILWGVGAARTTGTDLKPDESFRVRLIQPNAPQHQKWDPEWTDVFFARSLKLTSLPSDIPIDLVVWPETSVPFLLDGNVDALQLLSDAAGKGAHIIAGIQRTDGDAYYNSMVHLNPQGNLVALYDKYRLVPFGEYIPFSKYLPLLGLRGLAQQLDGFTAGTGAALIDVTGVPAYRPLICYEAIFPWAASQDGGQRPKFLLHITNDAWFGAQIGPLQHLAQVQFRAIEQGLPVLRSANTGVTAVIDPYGRILNQLGMNKTGKLDSYLPMPVDLTLYSKIGDYPIILFLLILGAIVKYVTCRKIT